MSFLHKIQNAAHAFGEMVTPVLHTSAFAERGVLTPEEFVRAGDQLVRTCPTWQWAAGDPQCVRNYLPNNKQFLITRGVTCEERVTDLEKQYEKEMEDDKDMGDGWFTTHNNITKHDDTNDIVYDAATVQQQIEKTTISEKSAAADDGFIDVNDFVENDLAGGGAGQTDIVHTRTYDVSITYDKYYQTPRVWLFGYDENQIPLTGDQILQDIMQDYANKTVTIERHPHMKGNVSYASIHPCRHAEVMKRIVSHLTEAGSTPDPSQYLFIFLKFIQSVIPTINYDLTIEVQAK